MTENLAHSKHSIKSSWMNKFSGDIAILHSNNVRVAK